MEPVFEFTDEEETKNMPILDRKSYSRSCKDDTQSYQYLDEIDQFLQTPATNQF